MRQAENTLFVAVCEQHAGHSDGIRQDKSGRPNKQVTPANGNGQGIGKRLIP